MEEMKGFTPDGYIMDQDEFTEYVYRTMPASINGCGWIAAFNLRHFLEGFTDFLKTMNEMNDMHKVNMRGPTMMYVMRGYLKKYIPQIKEVKGKDRALEKAKNSVAGIFRYTEEYVPHFVSYIKVGDKFRFFNVNDDIYNHEMSMDEFMSRKDYRGKTILMYVE